MSEEQMEKAEGLEIHEKITTSLSDAVDTYLDLSIKRLDKMFFLVCESRAAYIKSKQYAEEEDFVRSHNSRVYGNTKLQLLFNILKNNLG